MTKREDKKPFRYERSFESEASSETVQVAKADEEAIQAYIRELFGSKKPASSEATTPQ